VNALSKDTPLFAKIDGKYGVYNLQELYELHNQGRKIRVPALLNEHGSIGWVEVEDVVSFGEQPLKRITLATTRLYTELTEDVIIPAYSDHLFLGRKKQIKMKFKRVNEIKVTQDPSHNDSILLTTRAPLKIPEGNQDEWEIGFTLGFFVAEGTFHYRKRKNTKLSLATLNGYAKKKEMTLEVYLNYKTDVQQVVLTLGQSDFERKYVDILQKHFKFSKLYKLKRANGYQLYSSDLSLIHLIKEYTEGHTSHDKRVKNDVYNCSWKFLEGIMDGFLSGDGSYKKARDYFQVEITTNYKLYNDLIFLAKALGYDVHINNERFAKSPFPPYEKVYHYLRLCIFKNWHRRTALGLVKEHIKKIEDVGLKEAFNLVLKLLYPETDKRAIFNHLYFTAYGFLVSDGLKTLEPLTTPLAPPFLQK